jgi:hypothetical protein
MYNILMALKNNINLDRDMEINYRNKLTVTNIQTLMN